MRKRIMKILGYLVIIGMLMGVVPGVVVAMDETETGDCIKILDKESRLVVAQATSTAHLKNNVLDLYFTEQNSNLWQYQWQPGQWGESCYHEHFGVYTDDAGRTLESEEFTIDQSFTDPGGVPGTITAILHYSDVQIKRKVTLSSGDISFFEIEYTIKNTGSTIIDDVRFFQTIDFDIPWTSDCTDDDAWYDADHDYVVVNDSEYFKNGFTGSIPSDGHGIDHWSIEIYDDWDDGNLNNANNYGPGDPAIGLQYNFGNLAAGSEKVVTITVWSGEPTEEMEPKFNSITFGDNKNEHHTEDYPLEYNNDHCNVLRRGQSFDLNADIENFDDEDHKIIFMIVKPKFVCQMITARKDGTLSTEWDCIYQRNGNNFNFEMYIPDDDQVGKYQLVGEIQKKDGTEIYNIYGDDEDTLEFYVIFDIPEGLSNSERKTYLHDSDSDSIRDLNGAFYGTHSNFPKYDETAYFLNPFDKHIFENMTIAIASGDTEKTTTAEKLWEAVQNIVYYDDSPNKASGVPKMFSGVGASEAVQASQGIEGQYVTGQCLDYAHGLCALMRSIGIPARPATGVYQPNVFSYHAWCEAYIPEAPGDDPWYVYDAMDYTQEPHTPAKDLQSRALDPDKRSTFYYGPESTEVAVGDTNWVIDGGQVEIVGNPLHVVRVNTQADDILFEKTEYNHYSSSRYEYLQNGLSQNYSVNFSLDKGEVRVGELVTANITVTNNLDIEEIFNLTFNLYNSDFRDDGRDGLDICIYSYSESIVIPAKVTFLRNQTFMVNNTTYPRDAYLAVASIEEANTGSSISLMNSLVVLPAYDINIIMPDTIMIDDMISINVSICNQGDFTIENISIQLDIPSDYTTSDPLTRSVTLLDIVDCQVFTWNLTPIRNISCTIQYFHLNVTSDTEGNYSDYFCVRLDKYPTLSIIDVGLPSSVQNGSTFTVYGTIYNIGDLTAEDVQTKLILPPELTTSDDLIKYIGTIDPHANTTIMWDITANEAGTSAFTIITDSNTTSCEDVIFIPIFIYDHDLELSVEQSRIESDGELHNVNMTIHNMGDVEDSVFLQYLVTNPDISFSIYDGDERIISQSVLVPANGDKILNLNIRPEYDANGTITIHATSELDPTASDSINIEVISFIPQLNLDLYAGWNLISAPLNLTTWQLGQESMVGDPLNVTPENSLTSIYRYNTTSASFEKCSHYDGWGWAPATGSESFTELEPGRGYWVMADNDCTLTLTGTAPSDLDVSLDADWNCIGWYSMQEALLGDAAVVGDPLNVTPENSLTSIYRYNTTSVSFEKCSHYDDWGWAPATGSESFTELEPGRGYWVMAGNDCVWGHEV